MWFRLCRRQLLNNSRFSFLFIINLMVGLVGFLALNGFKESFQASLQGAAQNLLAADITIAGRRQLTEKEAAAVKEIVGEDAVKIRRIALLSMVRSGSRAQLVELTAITDEYPLYGSITVGNRIVTGGTPKEIQREPILWATEDLLLQLGVAVGDSLTIGEQSFKIGDMVVDDTSMSFVANNFAPRVYIGKNFLDATQLIRKGSTVRYTDMYRYTGTDIESIDEQLSGVLEDPGIQIKTRDEVGQTSGRIFRYLSDYLGLVALVAFFLSSFGLIFLFRGFLGSRQKDFAILMALGVRGRKILVYCFALISSLGLVSALAALGLSFALMPFLNEFTTEVLDLDIVLRLDASTVFLAIFLGSIGPCVVCLPFVMSLLDLKPSTLFSEIQVFRFQRSSKFAFSFLPAVFSFYFLAVWQSNSWQVGSLFFGALVVAIFLFAFAASWTLSFFESRLHRVPFKLRLSLQYLARNRVNATSAMLAISISMMLLAVIPLLRASIERELESPEGAPLPSVFMFDIQEDQVKQLRGFIQEQGLGEAALSPMIRARFLELNGVPLKRRDDDGFTRESQRASRMRNRGVNLTIRAQLDPSEKLAKGKWFSGSWDPDNPTDTNGGQNLPGISVERRYADRVGIKIGDILTYEIQSIPVKGVVQSLRSVKWNTFRPNFFIVFPPGVLEDAPKTYVGSLSGVDDAKRHTLQASLVEAFPNVSVINVSRLVEKLMALIDQMTAVLQTMAVLTLLVGIIVLTSVISRNISERRWDINLLKVLGGKVKFIRSVLVREAMIIATLAGVLGSGFGALISYLLAAQVFEGAWAFAWQPVLLNLVIVWFLTYVISAFMCSAILGMKPAELLGR